MHPKVNIKLSQAQTHRQRYKFIHWNHKYIVIKIKQKFKIIKLSKYYNAYLSFGRKYEKKVLLDQNIHPDKAKQGRILNVTIHTWKSTRQNRKTSCPALVPRARAETRKQFPRMYVAQTIKTPRRLLDGPLYLVPCSQKFRSQDQDQAKLSKLLYLIH